MKGVADMILTKIYDNVKNISDIDLYHVETALVKSDDLAKAILRVTSDHDRDYGIRLEDPSERLENGSAFLLGDHRLLVLCVIPDMMMVISPRGIDEMGQTAHMLGNLHKPVQVKDGKITLLFDEVVVQELDKKKIPYETAKCQLEKPLEYADLSFVHHHDHNKTTEDHHSTGKKS